VLKGESEPVYLVQEEQERFLGKMDFVMAGILVGRGKHG
jgi:hypothetical protein